MGIGSAFGVAAKAWDVREEEERQLKLRDAINQTPSQMHTGSDVSIQPVTERNPVVGSESMGANHYSSSLTDAQVLDAIAKNEGTYDSGYDTEYAYGKYGENRKLMSEMSINEVLDYGRNMVPRQKDSKYPSSAMGRYQMLSQTILDEMKHGSYNGTELFTDKVQDAMILQRMKRTRGMSDWREGIISDDKFKQHLSQEFASVNNPYTGKGHYGQGAKPLVW